MRRTCQALTKLEFPSGSKKQPPGYRKLLVREEFGGFSNPAVVREASLRGLEESCKAFQTELGKVAGIASYSQAEEACRGERVTQS